MTLFSMKYEPAIDHDLLLLTLCEAYGLHPARLTFVPVGFVTISYIVECPGQNPARYFLKVWNTSRWGTISARRLDTYLPLTEQLAVQGLRVPRCLPTQNGARKTRAGDLTLVLYEYLPYPALDALAVRPPDLAGRLGRLAAQLHRATPAVDTRALPREQFDVPFAETLLACLDELEAVSSRHRPGQQALRSLLLPHKAHLLAMLARLRQLGHQARQRHPQLVLVHTDLNGSNLLSAPDGSLVILDWEGAMLGPAEHDLFIFAGENFPAVLRGYCQAGGRCPGNLDAGPSVLLLPPKYRSSAWQRGRSAASWRSVIMIWVVLRKARCERGKRARRMFSIPSDPRRRSRTAVRSIRQPSRRHTTA
nr:aminoglycoside phosphotransferase [uncultured bacterium]